MSKKQNIDKLFQEKFQDFEITPDPSLWNAIDAKLKANKTKRLFYPFWIKFTGVAVAISIFVLFGVYKLNQFHTDKSSISNINNQINAKNDRFNTKIVQSNFKAVFKQSDSELNNKLQSHENLNNLKGNQHVIVNKKQKIQIFNKYLTVGSNQSKFKNSGAKFYILKNKFNAIQINNTAINTIDKKENIVENIKESTLLATKNDQTVAKKNSFDKHITNNEQIITNTSVNKNTFFINKIKNNTRNQITIDSAETNYKNSAQSNTTTKDNVNNLAENNLQSNRDFSKIKIDSTVFKTNLDAITLATVESKTLERLLNEKELKKKEQKINRWQVTSNIAPIYFGSTSNGSPLDKKFADNEKSFTISQSYGLGMTYSLTSKVKIRAGVNIINVDYDTKNIQYSMNNYGAKLANLNANSVGNAMSINTIKNITIFGKASYNSQADLNLTNEGAINQKMGFVEIPLEISYKTGNSKFNIDLITGFSTFYLQQNSVSLKTDNAAIKIGEASNLNQIHFSGNLGLGLNYKISNSFSASAEPIFKYQVNTFSSDAGNFKPYIFGVYTGVKYNF